MIWTTAWMTCTWIRNKGADTSPGLGGYSFFVSGWLSKSSRPLCSSHFCPIAKISTFTSKRVPGNTAGNYRRSYRRLIYPTRLSQCKYNFLLSRLEINCTLGDSVQMNLEGRVVAMRATPISSVLYEGTPRPTKVRLQGGS
jgi:hypothetical protein